MGSRAHGWERPGRSGAQEKGILGGERDEERRRMLRVLCSARGAVMTRAEWFEGKEGTLGGDAKKASARAARKPRKRALRRSVRVP